MIYLFIFILGTIIGSFLNVVGLRWNAGVSLSGRSKCPHCGKKLRWYELVPVLSYIVLRGRCGGCKSPISIQYPAIEILTGLIFLSIFNFQFSIFKEYSLDFLVSCILYLVIFSLYIAILIYDLRHKIIPNNLIYPAIILSLGFGIWRFVWNFEFGAWDFAAALIIFLFFASIWFVSGGRAMGFGDAKLGLSIGLLLGAQAGFSAVILASTLGAGIMLTLMLIMRITGLLRGVKKLTMKSEIPFAPFLILGAWLGLIYDLNLLQIPF